MNTSIGIMMMFGVIGLILVVAAHRYAIQRRQLSSGRNIGCFFPHMQDGQYVFDNPVTITTGGKWCRLLLKFKAQGAYRIDMTPKYFFKRVALAIGTPYTLTISDASGCVLYREEDKLTRFLAWLGGRGGSTETLFSQRGRGTQEGRIALLEFLPGHAGLYRILLKIQSRVEDEAPGSSSYWEVLEAELTLMEDVIPLSRIVKYPHKRVQL
jgi:hypothetical protein